MSKVNTSLQLPSDLLAEIKAIAVAEGRSVSSQIRLFLTHSVTRKNTEAPVEVPARAALPVRPSDPSAEHANAA